MSADRALARTPHRCRYHGSGSVLRSVSSTEYDFTTGWRLEVRVERVTEAAPCADEHVPFCIAGREPGPSHGCGGPQAYAERRRDALGWGLLAAEMDAVIAVLRRVADGDRNVLDDVDTCSDFERAVSRLRAREAFLATGFPRAAVNAALPQAFTAARGSL